MYGYFDRAGEAEFWARSLKVEEEGASFRVLSPPDQLVQVCAHSTHRSPGVAPIRWVADAVLLLRKEGDSFDWTRAVSMARLRGVSLALLRCLRYLRDGLGVSVPAAVLEELRRNRRAGEAMILYLRGAHPVVQRWYAALVWVRLLFFDGLAAVPSRLAMLRRYLRSSFRVPARVPLALFVVVKIFRRRVASAASNRDTTPS